MGDGFIILNRIGLVVKVIFEERLEGSKNIKTAEDMI